MADETIKIKGSLHLTIYAQPIITIPNALTIVRDGETVGIVAAQYDLSGVPPGLHELALAGILPTTQTLILPSAISEADEAPQAGRRTFRQMLMDIFNG